MSKCFIRSDRGKVFTFLPLGFCKLVDGFQYVDRTPSAV